MAVLVSLASAALAFPIAYYMARYTSGRVKAFFYIAVMMPMWASYIVKAYARTLLLAKDGVAQWFLQHGAGAAVGLAADGARRRRQHAVDLGAGAFLVFVYIWLPFMILPIRRRWSACRLRCCTPRRIWARDRRRPSATSFCRWRCRASPPGRSSPSR